MIATPVSTSSATPNSTTRGSPCVAAISAAHGLPLVVEFGVALDVLTGVAIMGLVIHEINRLFGETGTDRLRSLRG